MPYLCATCCLDHILRNLAVTTPEPRECLLCGNAATSVVDLEQRSTCQILRALLRFHFDEWYYNDHFSGDNIAELLAKPNPIVMHSNAEALEELCGFAFHNGYETPEMGISLFAGYWNGHQNPPLLSLEKTEHAVLVNVRRRLQAENHFKVSSEIRERLRRLQTRIEMFSETNTFFRARIGVQRRAIERDTAAHVFIPYANELILAPPPPLASAGRLNRAGVSYLYVATDSATAVAEVRPHPGHVVSIGAVRLARALRVADFSRVRLAEFSSSDAQLDDFSFLRTIEQDFATPVVPEERSNYLRGQLVADVLRELDFGAVAYRVSVSTGVNFCFFEPAHFAYVKGSGAAVRIQVLEYRTEPERVTLEFGEDYREL